MGIIKISSKLTQLTILILFLLLIGFFVVPKAHADLNIPLSSVFDTISTSRPSAASPLSADMNAGAGQAQITDNGSIFLASDSASIYSDLGETIDSGRNIASMSATDVPSAGNRMVYFTNTFTNAHHAGNALIVPITAAHTITFTTVTQIPASGKIILTFPGTSAATGASPSATTFSFNGLTTANAAANISYTIGGGGRTCASIVVATAGQTPTITCTVDSGGTIAGGTTVTFLIGCTDNNTNESACIGAGGWKPRLINPTKSSTAGTAQLWNINIQTTDDSGTPVILDIGKARIATIESVQVQAQVDPTLTFSIAPVTNGNPINTGNASAGCSNTEVTNSGINSTATNINLGLLSSSTINISAQLITVSTNASGGYALTATSSGHLINPSTGLWIPDSLTPTATTNGIPWYGIHPCGLNVTAIWYTTNRNDTTGGGTGAKYGWPTLTTPLTLASKSPGPIGISAGTTGDGLTSVEYAATVDPSITAGTYTTVVTYVATPTF